MVRDLIREYRLSLKKVKRARLKATDEEDRRLLGSCIDSLHFALEYMEKGKHPENRRGISRLSYAQRETPMDPDSYTFVRAAMLQKKHKDNLTDEQRELLDDLLAMLTVKEREAFVMVRGNGYSFGQAAELMRVSKGTVQNLVCRAEEKLYFVVRKPSNSKNVCLNEPVQRVMF